MKSVHAEWTSSLTPKELANLFRSTSNEIFNSAGRRLLSAMPGRGTAGKMEFFTPQNDPDDSPFAQFEDEVAFSVGVQGPQGGFQGAMPVTIHMYVYDKGSARKVVFRAPYNISSFKSKAIDHVRRYGQALAALDPEAHEQQ